MKNLLTFTFVFISNIVLAQSLVPIPSSYSSPNPLSATVCKTTSDFHINNMVPPSLPATGGWPSTFSLSLQIFVVSNVTMPYSPNNLTLLPYPWTSSFPNCYGSNAGGSPILPMITNFSSTGVTLLANAPTWDATNNVFQWNLDGSHDPFSTIELLEYEFYIDCSLKSLLGGNLSIVQRWYYTGGMITNPMLLSSQPPVPIPVISPNIVPILPIANSQYITVSAPYNPTGQSDWHFAFQNNGTAEGQIVVEEFLTDPCGSYTMVPGTNIMYAISTIPPATSSTSMTILSNGLPWTTLTWNVLNTGLTALNIPMNSYLYIRKTVKIDDCMNSCLPPTVANAPQMHFSWHCADADIPPNCNECQQDYDIELRYNKGIESYKIERINPSDAIADFNTECQGDEETWQFVVENTGDATLHETDVRFYNPLVQRSLSMISGNLNASAIQLIAPATNLNCMSLTPLPVPFTPSFTTCGTFPSNPTSDFHVKILELKPAEKCTIVFRVKNIPSDDASYFLNSAKYYNQWRVQSVCTTACNTLISPTYANSVRPSTFQGISQYAVNTPIVGDLNLQLNHFPTNNHITVPNQNTNPYFTPDPTFYFIDFDGLTGSVEDLQALGYNGSGGVLGGYLRVKIATGAGLSISNPNNVLFVVPKNSGGYAIIRSIMYEKFCTSAIYPSVPTSSTTVNGVPVDIYPDVNCDCLDKNSTPYTLYFRISDLVAQGIPVSDLEHLFTQGKFIFGLTACCFSASPSEYNVEFSLLPNENCFNLTQAAPGSVVNCNNPGAGAICCWLPLSSKGGQIQVHCPGCKAPGIIVDNYKMSRTTFGYPDISNDGIADITGSGNEIVYFPGQTSSSSPYSKYGQVEWYKSVYGDELEDYMVAHFEDGDNFFGGYTYADMFNGGTGVDLDVIQLFRTIKESGISGYNVQLTGFDFYLDNDVKTPGTPAPLDADMFDQLISTPTLLHMFVPTSGLNLVLPSGNKLFERKAAPNDHEMVYTFTEADLQYLFTAQPAGITVSLANGWSIATDIDFLPWQQYRLRARYKICGNKQSTNPNVPDEGEVSDFMYLKPEPVPLSQLTVGMITGNQMKNTSAEVYSLGVEFYTPGMQCSGCAVPAPSTNQACNLCPAMTDANYANNYFFYCEPSGGLHYFLSTDGSNNTSYKRMDDPDGSECKAYVEILSTTSFMLNTSPNKCFKYEFKPPHLFQSSFEVNEPTEWDWLTSSGNKVEMDLTSFNCGFWNCNSSPIIMDNNSVSYGSVINFNINNIPSKAFNTLFGCYTTNMPTDAFISDEASFQRIRIYLKPEDCSNFTITPPLPSMVAADSKVEFTDNIQSCDLPMASGCNYNLGQVENQNNSPLTLPPPNPNLVFNIAPGVYNTNTGTVSWHFTISNFGQTPANPNPSAAKNVYVALNNALPFLTNWKAGYNLFDISSNQIGTSTQQCISPYPAFYTYCIGNIASGNYLWLTPNGSLNQLDPGHYLEGEISAAVNCSALPSTFDFVWGWNCFGETQSPSIANLCFEETTPVTINSIPGELATFTNVVPPNYTACDPTPQPVEVCFKNLSPIELAFPQTVTILPQNGSIVQLTGTTSIVDLTGSLGLYSLNGGSGTWTINSTNSTMIMNDGFCIRFNVTTYGCNVGPLQLPDVIVSGNDVCGNAFATPYTLPFVLESGSSFCAECYTITKTAGVANAAPGDPVMFTIKVCGNNGSGAVPVVLTDILPQYFTPSPAVVLPQSYTLQVGCTTVYVTGSFSDEGLCSDLMNVNTATITTQNTTQSASACINVSCPDGGPTSIHIDSDNDSQSLFPTGSISGQTVVIHDGVTFTVNTPGSFIINNCTFLMGSGSSISVDPTFTLSVLNNSLFSSCPFMWAGIRVGVNGHIDFSNSTIKDAERGIFLDDRTSFELKDSHFLDCVVGFETVAPGYMTPISGNAVGNQFGKVGFTLKGEYPGQPQHGNVGRAGMLLNDVTLSIGSIGSNENEFFNLNYGIEMHNSDIVIENSRFHQMVADNSYSTWGVLPPFGCAITARASLDNDIPAALTVLPLASGNYTIEDAPVGVYNNFVNTRVMSTSMNNVRQGVFSEDNELRNTTVANCTINARFRGIDWRNNDRANFMTASVNTIVVDPLPGNIKGTACIYMVETSPGNNANYRITDNLHLESKSAIYGIAAKNVENAWIGYNHIFTNQGTVQPGAMIGIGLDGGGRNTINCNYVSNSLPHTFNFTRGMDVNLSINNKIDCNNFTGGTPQNPTGSFIGIRFGGACGGTQMRGNAMSNNWEGLHLNNVGLIGVQIGVQNHNGNTWINYQNLDGAINDNYGFENLSEFRIHTTMGINMQTTSQFYPHLNSSNLANGWFFFDPGRSPFSCQNSQTCLGAISGGGDDELERKIATEGIETAVYAEETKSMTQQYLFRKLAEDTTIIANDTIYQQFYAENQTSAIGELYGVETSVAEAEKYNPQDLYLLQTADNLIALKNDSINVLDSLHKVSPLINYNIQRQNLISTINTVASTKTSIRLQHRIDAGNKLVAAQFKNTTIMPAELPETNNKLINEVVVAFKKTGRSSVATYYSQILSIAQQCPYSGGPAVYIAREFVEMIDPNVDYDDDAVCLQSGIYRESVKSNDKQNDKPEISIVPNPANEKIEVKVSGKLSGLCHILILNSLGEQTLAEQMVCDSRKTTISVSILKPGIYTVKVYNNELTKTTKLVICR